VLQAKNRSRSLAVFRSVRSGLARQGFSSSPIIVLVALALATIYPTASKASGLALSGILIYFVWIALSESWNLVGGYAGLLNLGLVAFFALGGVTAANAALAGISFLPAIIIAGFAGAFLAVVLIPTFRLRSDYFAIGTLVIPFIAEPLVLYITSGRVSYNLIIGIVPSEELYYSGLAMAGLAIFGIYFLMRSRIGIALRSMGDDETASSSLGVNVLLYKTVALVVSGFVAAVAGGYYFYLFSGFRLNTFDDLTWSFFPIFMVFIGGTGTFEGPIVGALIFSGIDYYSPRLLIGSSADQLIFSVFIMAVAVLLPKGIIPSLRRIAQKLSRLRSPRGDRSFTFSDSTPFPETDK
jgi:branched-chain amino acid transport system permease protein